MFVDDALAIWWVFPVAVGVASLALSTGISGALFFAPFFLLVVGLDPAQAIGAGLMTELFGTSFATYNYARQGVIDLAFAKAMLIVTVPLGMVGAALALIIDAGALQLIFGGTMVLLALVVLRSSLRMQQGGAASLAAAGAPITVIRARDGQEYTYAIGDKRVGLSLCAIGAVLTGLMSAGLPEINTTQLMARYRLPPRVAVATSIMVLTVTVFFAVGIHAIAGEPAWHVVVWSIPGVILGAQIGPRLQRIVPPRLAERLMAAVFVGVGALVIVVEISKT
jgi:uncharacterized protein